MTLAILDLMLRAAAAAVLALIAFGLPRTATARGAGWIARTFVFGLIAYLVCSAPGMAVLPRALQWALGVPCLLNPFLFWLLSKALFDDGFTPNAGHGTAGAALVILGAPAFAAGIDAGFQASNGYLVTISAIGFKFAAVLLVGAALALAYRGRRSDLVERRRGFRIRFVTVAGGYMVLVLLTELLLRGQPPHPLASMLNAAVITLIALTVATSLLAPRIDLLFDPIAPEPRRPQVDQEESRLRNRLEAALRDKLHHQEGLSIARLAAHLDTQEHRLRQMINGSLGFRNFNDFLHRHRIADARAQLADPALARRPVLSIALGLGYGSIGPFNRAFREITGETPTAYRRNALGDMAPDAEGPPTAT